MSEHKYDRLANILMFVAIGSALLFDSGKFSHVIVGAVGGVAGAMAVALYFVNQRHGAAAKQEEPAKADAEIAVEKLAASKNDPMQASAYLWDTALGGEIERFAIKPYRREMERLYFSRPAAIHAARNWLRVVDPGHALRHPEAILTPNDVAACAIEIIRHLSSDEDRDRWEFSFGPNGLRISPKKRQPWRSAAPQEDFDFGQVQTMVQ